ncbi:hypothetical protein XU18_0289 [Perkinsela sp. CCAP 1560/4]|nr:hypothetical protein XU18_0289 [Perkinsela sp. CCAP 1560/4]|eukprot:KNH09604.1 hypothetical protein XU18_0289 [Perkinsela sp. CCAP 1560/4]
MFPSVWKAKGESPFLSSVEKRFDDTFSVYQGFKDFARCVSFSRNIHNVGFMDPTLTDCAKDFEHSWNYFLYRSDASRDHLVRKRRSIVDLSSHPWEFKQKYIDLLKSQGRYLDDISEQPK